MYITSLTEKNKCTFSTDFEAFAGKMLDNILVGGSY